MAIRADQVGSLLRPPELLASRAAFDAGRIGLAELRAEEDDAIRRVVQKQRDIGIGVMTDGELRRGSWLSDMAAAVDGFVDDSVLLEWHGPGGGREKSAAKIVGARLRKRHELTASELPLLKAICAEPFKITLPAPSNFVVAGFKPGITDQYYATREALLDDLVAIVRDEIVWLLEQGVPHIQLDAPFYSHYLDPDRRAAMQRGGGDPEGEFARAVAGDNRAIEGLQGAGATIAIHVCRGNSRSRWYTEGGYEAIAEKLFHLLRVDRFLLEYDTERAGGFEPLGLVPKDKDVVLGLVTTKEGRLEDGRDLRRRIDAAAKYMPLDRLALSPQCGFASVAAGNLLSEDDQWRKLELIVRTARDVWGTS